MALSLQRYTLPNSGRYFNRILKERCEREREMSMAIPIQIGRLLAENVIVEILSWLPVKALLQFKSVCKSWYAIIASPHFISKHLENYYNNSGGVCPLLQHLVTHAEPQVYELLLDETHRTVSYEILHCMPNYGSYICGPCDGIYYLFEPDFGKRALWNPAINDLKVLPPLITKPNLPSNITYSVYDIYGFGFDPVTKDYRVVVIKEYWSAEPDDEIEIRHPLSVLIYSLRTDSWRYWGDLARHYDLDNNKCYIFLNGVFYWLGYKKDEVIISFDLAMDSSQEIHVADYDSPAYKCLGIYHDSVALFTIHELTSCFDIWTLKDGCWTKKFSMGPLSQVRKPVGHWQNNKVLLACLGNRLILCDPATQEISELGFQNSRRCEVTCVYMESLVSVSDRSRWGQQEEVETIIHQV